MEIEVDGETQLPNTESYFYNPFKNLRLSFILLLSLVVLVYIIIFAMIQKSGGNSNSASKSYGILLLELILWISLIVVLYINIKNYNDNNFNFKTSMNNLFNSKMSEMEVHVQNNKEEKPDVKKECETNNGSGEVFHLPSNIFTYDEAKEVCKSLNARLATYDEIEKAYNGGANWCSYGWSEDQLALFPTQKSVYNELKTIKGHENDCGRPGINGGFMKNKNMKFGINCYGKKPYKNDNSDAYMHSINHSPAITDAEKEKEELKNVLDNILVAPFNKDKWSSF